jgi:hypothetical protein
MIRTSSKRCAAHCCPRQNAAATLKLELRVHCAPWPLRLPAAKRRGLIETIVHAVLPLPAAPLPAAERRGLIEALTRTVSFLCIETAIRQNPTTGQAGRLVRFLAGVYNGQDYPFDLTDLRALDTRLANACLDYLNYDRNVRRSISTAWVSAKCTTISPVATAN